MIELPQKTLWSPLLPAWNSPLFPACRKEGRRGDPREKRPFHLFQHLEFHFLRFFLLLDLILTALETWNLRGKILLQQARHRLCSPSLRSSVLIQTGPLVSFLPALEHWGLWVYEQEKPTTGAGMRQKSPSKGGRSPRVGWMKHCSSRTWTSWALFVSPLRRPVWSQDP